MSTTKLVLKFLALLAPLLLGGSLSVWASSPEEIMAEHRFKVTDSTITLASFPNPYEALKRRVAFGLEDGQLYRYACMNPSGTELTIGYEDGGAGESQKVTLAPDFSNSFSKLIEETRSAKSLNVQKAYGLLQFEAILSPNKLPLEGSSLLYLNEQSQSSKPVAGERRWVAEVLDTGDKPGEGRLMYMTLTPPAPNGVVMGSLSLVKRISERRYGYEELLAAEKNKDTLSCDLPEEQRFMVVGKQKSDGNISLIHISKYEDDQLLFLVLVEARPSEGKDLTISLIATPVETGEHSFRIFEARAF